MDIGLGQFVIMADRLEAVDFSRYLGAETFTILMKTPSHISKADSLIAPFSRDVSWRCYVNSTKIGPELK